MRYPTSDRRVSSPYGYRVHPVTEVETLHAGADFPYPGIGAPLYAVDDFTVIGAHSSYEGGNWVRLRLPDGVEATYFHMQAPSPLKVGQTGGEGTVVGHMGNTGAYTTGPHVHFETRHPDGTSFDPVPYLDRGIAAGGGAQPFPEPKEDDDMAGIRYIKRKTDPESWMIVGPTDLPYPGYQITDDVKVAETWGIMYGTEKGDAFFVVDAPVYTAIMNEAVRLYRLLNPTA